MPSGWFSLGGDAWLVAVSLAALALGGGRERIAGVVFLLGGALTLAAAPLTHRYDPVLVYFLVDLAVILALAPLAWRSRERWPVIAIGCQGVALAVHVIRSARPAMPAWTYVTALSLTSDAALLCLAVGTWGAWRRRR